MWKFNLKRFGTLVRWTLTMDRRHHSKTVLSWTVILALMFLFFTCVVNFNNDIDGIRRYQPCGAMTIMMFVTIMVMGPAYMFNSMKSRHDDQRLLMLPASNLEKYLVRYLNWPLMLVLALVALVAADLVQYAINRLVGHEAMLVMQWLADMPRHLHRFFGPVPDGLRRLLLALAMLALWIHSLYAVGATLFRSHKYNWVLTSLAIILGILLLSYAAGSWFIVNQLWWCRAEWFDLLFLVLSLLNFWLSYRLFCRTQVKGKFINL